MRFNDASIYPSVMLERQDGALTSIGARIGILDEQHSTLQLKRMPRENAIHSAQALVKWMSGTRIDQRRRAPASSRPHHPLANTPAATVKRTAAPKQAVTKS